MSQTALSDTASTNAASPDTASTKSVSPDGTSPDAPALRDQVARTIEALLPKVLGRPVPTVREDAPLFEEIGLDSASTLELILELEDALEAQIDVEEISQDDLVTLGALVDFLAGHVVLD